MGLDSGIQASGGPLSCMTEAPNPRRRLIRQISRTEYGVAQIIPCQLIRIPDPLCWPSGSTLAFR